MAVVYLRNNNGVFVELKTLRGRSAYSIAVDNGFVGTVAQWLASLEGAPGSTPVKGVDYYTATEKEALIQEILARLSSNAKTTSIYIDGELVFRASAVGTSPAGYMVVHTNNTVVITNETTGETTTWTYSGDGTLTGLEFSTGEVLGYDGVYSFGGTESNVSVSLTTVVTEEEMPCTIAAGTYICAETPTLPDETISGAMEIDGSPVTITAYSNQIMYGILSVYDAGTDYWAEAEDFRTITISEDASVSEEFYEWFTANYAAAYTTSIKFMAEYSDGTEEVLTLFKESAVGYAPAVEITINANTLVFQGETTSYTYTLPQTIIGLAFGYDQAQPADGWEVGETRNYTALTGANRNVMLYGVYSDGTVGGDIEDDGAAEDGDSEGFKGIWVFNETISVPSWTSEAVAFGDYLGGEYTTMRIASPSENYYILMYDDTGVYDFSTGVWGDSAYRTITITDDSYVTDTFKTWLKANATK